MKHNLLRLLVVAAFLIHTSLLNGQNKISTSSDNYFTVENYYKIKWGYADEFIELWKKNHYPLLKKVQQSGDIISINAEKPILHSGEDTRWDFKVTIVWKNAELGVGKVDPTSKFKSQLYPDLEKLKRDEQTRFSLLIAHWDVMIVNIDPEK
jgi:hypothetical protein